MKTRLFACAAFSALFCLGMNAQTWVKGTGKLYVNPVGTNVGIGTASPTCKLDVIGNISTQGSGEVGPTLQITNSSKTGDNEAMYWRIFNMSGNIYGNSLQFWAYSSKDLDGTLRHNRFTLMDNGNVGIGTMSPGVKLDVVGTIRAHEVKVCLNQGCDYVFAPDYDLMSLPELEQFVSTNRHLPEVAPAAKMEQDGIDLSEMNALLLKKVEELTLYVIDLNKEVQTLKAELNNQ